MFNRVFDVRASGGTQTWKVRRGHPGRAVGAFVGTLVTMSAGLSLTVIGAALGPTEYYDNTYTTYGTQWAGTTVRKDYGTMLGLMGAGIGWTVVGAGVFLPLTLSSLPKVEQIE